VSAYWEDLTAADIAACASIRMLSRELPGAGPHPRGCGYHCDLAAVLRLLDIEREGASSRAGTGLVHAM